MKWISTKVIVLVLPMLLLGTSTMYAQTLIDDWGDIGGRLIGSGWTIDNDANTPAGDVMLSGADTPGNWTAVRGGFDQMSATLDQALVVSGQFEIVGGDIDAWNPLRFGVFQHNDIGDLTNQYMADAQWGYIQYAGTDSAAFLSNEADAHGYLLTNRTGANDAVSGQGGIGIAWAVNGGSWISTWSGGTNAMGHSDQAPRRAIMEAGMYDFEISVQPLADGTTELNWFILSDDDVSYWHAGTHVDTTAQKTDFNGFTFSMQNGIEGITGINLYGVQVELGDPVTIPEKPFSSFYVDAWGGIGGRLAGSGWTIDNDSTTLVGDALLSGDAAPGNWTAVRGGFGESVSATLEEALIVSGELEIVGGDIDAWNPFRFGLFQHNDIGSLTNQYLPDAQWGYEENAGTDSAAFVSNEADAHGYLFTNRTGANDAVSGQGGIGIAWAVNGGSWISTWSGGTNAMGHFDQAPRRAIMEAGMYEFEISVQPLADGTTEVRWYILSDDEESYWHAGTHIDTTAQKTDFNGFTFSMQNGIEGITGLNLYAVQVDRGDPITIPEKPFSSFYVDAWGSIGGRLTGSGWTIDNDSTTLVGDAFLSGDASPGNWTAVRGGFGESVSATLEEALIVSGELEIIGGDIDAWSPFRFGIFQHNDIGSLTNQYLPDAQWGYEENAGTDSAAFVSNEADAHGYMFTNRTGANDAVSGQGGIGVAWAVNGGSWISTWSGGTNALGHYDQAPRRAIMAEGTYEFEISVQPLADGTTEVRWYILSDDEESYWHGGTHIDTTAQKTDFNGFSFAMQNGIEGITGLNLYAVEVDRGDPITIPEAPFSSFYVDSWGFLGGKFGGAEGDSTWALTPGDLVGDVTIAGDAATGWAAVAGSFGSAVRPSDEALVLTGDISFEGGGFEDANSFRLGLFNQNLGGQDSTETVGFVWGGDEAANGYLFIAPNGSDGAPTWASGGEGSVGGVAGGVWYDPADAGAYNLGPASLSGTPTAGTYEFELSVQPSTGKQGANDVRLKLNKDDDSYSYEVAVIDNSPVVSSYNTIVFATNNSSTTELKIEALEVTMGEGIVTDVEGPESTLPQSFALEQNYPNPFNPVTTIKFDLPQTADVQLEVFNLLGQKVMTLVSGSMQAGTHQVNFDAQNLASGMYIYRIEAANFVSTKKMMLIK